MYSEVVLKTCPSCHEPNQTQNKICIRCRQSLLASHHYAESSDANARAQDTSFAQAHTPSVFMVNESNKLPNPTPNPTTSSNASSKDPMLGLQLGNFVIRNKIGQGGFGAVYRAEQIHLGQFFAIKSLHFNKQVDPVMVARIMHDPEEIYLFLSEFPTGSWIFSKNSVFF